MAVGQVIHYRQQLDAAGHEPVYSAIATERQPSDKIWEKLCADEGILLIWPPVAEERLKAHWELRRAEGTLQ